ncbi:MAG: hypothetical protein CVT98_10390, partial [Bacteroidetes bacterium HGW-Bacteroidetes-15]
MKIVGFLFIAIGLFILPANRLVAQESSTSRSIEQEIFDLVNQHRKSIGLNPFAFSEILDEQSRTHSQNMASGKTSFSHNNFEKRTAAIRDKIGGLSFAENVAYGHRSAESAVKGWLNSKGHKDNIEGDFTHMGVGIGQAKDGTYFITQIFVKIEPNSILVLNDQIEAQLQVDIVELVNQHRATLGLNPLIISDVVAVQSRIHSQGMASGKVRFSHDGFDKRAAAIREQIGGVGFAENVAYGQTNAESVVEGW